MSMDDSQWQQQQDEQRMARERAQQQESERTERSRQERIEREQQEEDERLEREERAQRRPAGHNFDFAEEIERGAARPLFSGVFSLLRRRRDDGRPGPQEPGIGHSGDVMPGSVDAAGPQAAPIVPPMHILGDGPPVATATPQLREVPLASDGPAKRVSVAMLLGLCAALVGGAMWAYAALSTPQRMPSGLEGTTEEFRDGTPSGAPPGAVALPEPAVDVAVASGAPIPQLTLLQEPVVTTALGKATSDPEPGPPGPQEQLLPQVSLGESDVSGAQNIPDVSATSMETLAHSLQRISQLEKEVEQLKLLLGQRQQALAMATATPADAQAPAPAKASSAKAYIARKPARRRQAATAVPVEVAPPAPQYNGRLLSVDMWDGKPSVVVSTGDPSDTRVRVMQPGESFNGITLREASVQDRNASFDVGGGKLVQMVVQE